MTTNEAAERLLDRMTVALRLERPRDTEQWQEAIDAALAAERRATALVEQDKDGFWGFSERGARILNVAGTHDGKVDVMDLLHALAVAEEAGR